MRAQKRSLWGTWEQDSWPGHEGGSGLLNLIDYPDCNKVLSFGVSNTYLPKLEDSVHFICIWIYSEEIRILNKLHSICADVDDHSFELNLDWRRGGWVPP